jgi:hypothetical protein
MELPECSARSSDSVCSHTVLDRAPCENGVRGFVMAILVAIVLVLLALWPSSRTVAKATAPAPQIWFAMSSSQTQQGRRDWERLFFEAGARWPDVFDHVHVISAAEQSLNALSEDELGKFASTLNQHGKALSIAVLAQNWVNEPKCGYGVEGYSSAAENARLVTKLRRVGARISYIGMDEPLFFGHYYRGPNACRSSIENVAARVKVVLNEYTKVYQQVMIFDTEPFPGVSDQRGWQADYTKWSQVFYDVVGRPISGLNIDINWPTPWADGLVSAVNYARSQNLSVGIIYWASPKAPAGRAVTNEMWLDSAVHNFSRIEQDMHITPDRAMFVSWSKFPERTISDQNGPGQDYLVKQYMQRRNVR